MIAGRIRRCPAVTGFLRVVAVNTRGSALAQPRRLPIAGRLPFPASAAQPLVVAPSESLCVRQAVDCQPSVKDCQLATRTGTQDVGQVKPVSQPCSRPFWLSRRT